MTLTLTRFAPAPLANSDEHQALSVSLERNARLSLFPSDFLSTDCLRPPLQYPDRPPVIPGGKNVLNAELVVSARVARLPSKPMLHFV